MFPRTTHAPGETQRQETRPPREPPLLVALGVGVGVGIVVVGAGATEHAYDGVDAAAKCRVCVSLDEAA